MKAHFLISRLPQMILLIRIEVFCWTILIKSSIIKARKSSNSEMKRVIRQQDNIIWIQKQIIQNRMLTRVLQNIKVLFNVQKYGGQDIKTICSLIHEPFPVYNQFIQLHQDVSLIDQHQKFIGKYTASQARKKAITLKKDIILVKSDPTLAVCKVLNFREKVIQKFFDEIVNKRNQSIINRAQTSKQLRISLVNESVLKIKANQIIQLAKKNLNVRISMICKSSQRQQAMAKFDYLKYLLQNKCTIQKDIESNVVEQQEQESKQKSQQQKTGQQKIHLKMLVKSKQNQFTSLLQQTKKKDQDQAVKLFLDKYYKQEDIQMKDLQFNKKQTDNHQTSFTEQMLNMFSQAKSKNDANLNPDNKKENQKNAVSDKDKQIKSQKKRQKNMAKGKQIGSDKKSIKQLESVKKRGNYKNKEKDDIKGKGKAKSKDKGSSKKAKGSTNKSAGRSTGKSKEKTKEKDEKKKNEKEKNEKDPQHMVNLFSSQRNAQKLSQKQAEKKEKQLREAQDQKETLKRILNKRLKRILQIKL